MLVHLDHAGPQVAQLRGVGFELGIDQRGQRVELFRGLRAGFVPALHGQIECVGGSAIFPIRPAIAADGGQGVAELLFDGCERGMEAGILEMRVSVLAVPVAAISACCGKRSVFSTWVPKRIVWLE